MRAHWPGTRSRRHAGAALLLLAASASVHAQALQVGTLRIESTPSAAEVELINEAVPFERLEARVAEIAGELARIPLSQLRAQKLIVNQAYENMGLASTQLLGGILDGLMRNTPDALEFIQTAESQGVRAAVQRRDGPFGDYSQAPPELRPDPTHVIVPDDDH